MKILHTVKYYAPSKGGMESVVKSIIDGIIQNKNNFLFTVYANSHVSSFRKEVFKSDRLISIKEFTPFLFRSQPVSLRYKSLKNLIIDTDVIHHHYPFPNMELALLRNLDLMQDKKLIITWHANVKNSRWSWIEDYYAPITRKLLNRADHIVVTSPQLIESSSILKDYQEKLSVIPLSFNPGLFERCGVRKFPTSRKFRLLFVGKLRTYKGLEFLIQILSQLDVLLTIVGKGENSIQLKHQVAALCLQDKVEFLDEVSDTRLAEIYRQSDLFILPSVNEAEAFGVVQLEAMINGLPVINTKLDSGVPYVSLDGITGYTVPPCDSIALKEAIVKIMSNEHVYEEFSKNSIDRAMSFTQERMAEAYEKIYRE